MGAISTGSALRFVQLKYRGIHTMEHAGIKVCNKTKNRTRHLSGPRLCYWMHKGTESYSSQARHIPWAKDRSNDRVHTTAVGVFLFGQTKVGYTHTDTMVVSSEVTLTWTLIRKRELLVVSDTLFRAQTTASNDKALNPTSKNHPLSQHFIIPSLVHPCHL